MFDISFGEILLIAVVALVVLGPERLPGAARTAGALLRRVRRGWDSVRAEVTRELEAEELRAQLREAQDAARAAVAQVRTHANDTSEVLGGIAQDAQNLMRAKQAQTPPALTADASASPDPARETHDDHAG
ncbi:MAG TPA: Sec-independent protein translocase protein TatB [Rhodanobacteraceae bacterium]|nr:Sec-independent protein translocase protein TatB [Rhodanobacteraceae bacterium]